MDKDISSYELILSTTVVSYVVISSSLVGGYQIFGEG
jgi:hypothetical protein